MPNMFYDIQSENMRHDPRHTVRKTGQGVYPPRSVPRSSVMLMRQLSRQDPCSSVILAAPCSMLMHPDGWFGAPRSRRLGQRMMRQAPGAKLIS
ncbi:hypothetical protein TanjilG_06151 [Lupinus angustifolius]|uniref:Uncharacterized protein n=1 Tax=Lupinus angustifolius TaxID=3871 RepID=A0A394DF83_LUPAN|nr:hypothetical protein TanjilG_06151 [Lupinus angustifolius]